MWIWFLDSCWYFQLLVDRGKLKYFLFLFVIMNDSFKEGTYPHFSDILTLSPSLTRFWLMFPFFIPWKYQKTFGVLVFSGGTKWGHWLEMAKKVDRNNSNLPVIINSDHAFKSLFFAFSSRNRTCCDKNLGYWLKLSYWGIA